MRLLGFSGSLHASYIIYQNVYVSMLLFSIQSEVSEVNKKERKQILYVSAYMESRKIVRMNLYAGQG